MSLAVRYPRLPTLVAPEPAMVHALVVVQVLGFTLLLISFLMGSFIVVYNTFSRPYDAIWEVMEQHEGKEKVSGGEPLGKNSQASFCGISMLIGKSYIV
ncbi:hypothetical protein OG21DRAFT_627409 [Imleria badia]|nr:hypothetical protein OG21DRAFT_627409 [Imleria badia]